MTFYIDKQTLDDLNIFGKKGSKSVYDMFNLTRTRGGARLLDEMFRYPLANEQAINHRSGLIRSIMESHMVFPLKAELLDQMEYYLSNTDPRTQLSPEDNTLARKLKNAVGADERYQQVQTGVNSIMETLKSLKQFLQDSAETDNPYSEELHELRALINHEELDILHSSSNDKKPTFEQTAKIDIYTRFKIREKLLKIVNIIYYLDVYIAIARVAAEKGLSFAQAFSPNTDKMIVEDVFHPLLENAVPNDLKANRDSNLIFLTGANMAGKSTFMKSFGLMIFLAHIGLPVSAKKLEFSVFDGMYSTINLPDNLGNGYSHFYAEVKRVKKVVEHLGTSKRLLVIFDELFRGTNVKDAYEATVAISEAFIAKRDSLFIISTHIIEAGEQLKASGDNAQFVYLPTIMEGNNVRYTYRLQDGISSDRQGMMIINNEQILETLNENPRTLTASDDHFSADQQTLQDLNLLGEFRPDSIFNVYKRTQTKGGKLLLEEMFRTPLTSAVAINERVEIFKFFQQQKVLFPIETNTLFIAEKYLQTTAPSGYLGAFISTGRLKLMQLATNDQEFESIHEGIIATAKTFQQLRAYLDALYRKVPPRALEKWTNDMEELLSDVQISWVFDLQQSGSWFDVAKKDYQLRSHFHSKVQKLLKTVYHLDLFSAIGALAAERNFCFPIAIDPPNSENAICIEDFYHPGIKNAVPNKISLTKNKNILFLTGANMAGKSTVMKSFSISVYLAHMGFPIAARSMEFSVQQGLYTSINVSDNLNMGHSHFYAEVLRVKQVAKEVASGKRLLVVFDELFKGTNVKDAYDATAAVTEAFGKHRNCAYIISTHIIEVGNHLAGTGDNFQFQYMPTVMNNGTPEYPYRLEAGITDDRHGMVIIRNEGILDLIGQNSAKKLTSQEKK